MKKIDYVGAGEMKVSIGPSVLKAVGVGSCLIICLFDTKKRVGIMSHAMLPSSSLLSFVSNPFKFVDKSIEIAVEKMQMLGCKKKDIVAKIIGGANLFNGLELLEDIGKKNIEIARKKLGELGIKIVAEDVGGNFGRSVYFHTDTGEVVVITTTQLVKKL